MHLERLLLFNLATADDDPILGFTSAWITAFAARSTAVDVVTMREGGADLPPNVTVWSAGKEAGYSRPRRAIRLLRKVHDLSNQHPYDGCFAHMIPSFAAITGPILRRRGVPLVLWYASGSRLPSLRFAARYARAIVAPSPESFPLRGPRVLVTGHGIDTDLFSPHNDVPDGRSPVLVTVGRIAPVKRLELLVEACAWLRTRGVEVRLRVVGPIYEPRDEDYGRLLLELIEERGLDKQVEIVGPVPYRKMPEVYRSADVFVSASATGSLDKAALEAMSCGLPCVVTDVSAGDVMSKAGCGPAVAGSPEAIGRGISEMLELTPAMRKGMGDRLRSEVMRNHSLEQLVDRILLLFRP